MSDCTNIPYHARWHGRHGLAGIVIAMALSAAVSLRAQDTGTPPPPSIEQKATANKKKADDSSLNLPEVIVTASPEGSAKSGYRSESAELGPMGGMSLKDTPYSLNVTPGELIENRNAHNPTDALKTNPTVAPLMSSSGYSSMSRVMVRGFTAGDQSDLRDGMTDRSFTLPPVEDIERIEVLNGLSGFLYGFSAVGGTVNYVTKQPTATPRTSVSMGQYNKGILFGQVDSSGPIGNDKLTYRLTGYGENGDTYIDGGRQSRWLASGALRYRVCDDTYLKFNFYQQGLETKGIQPYFDISGIGYAVPSALDPTKQYGQSWTYDSSQKGVYDLALDSRINDILSVRAAYRYGVMSREYRWIGARFLNANNGTYSEREWETPKQDEEEDAAYALFDARFDTWGIEHNVTFGYTHWGFTFWRGADVSKLLGNSSIYSPASYDVSTSCAGQTGDMNTITHNFLVGDRIVFDPSWSLLTGVNYAQTVTETFGSYYAASKPEVSGDSLTPTVGLVYKPHPDVSTYVSYMQGLEQGGTASSTAKNAGQVLDPAVSDQYEVGAKATLWKRLDLSAALFRIDKVNQYLDTGDNVYKQDGREVHQGVELLATGKITDCLTIVGGWTWMQASIDKAANPATEGAVPVNVPKQQARLYLEYDIPKVPWIPGVITLSTGVNYYGERPVDIPNAHYIPDTTLLDAGLRYRPNDRLVFTANVTNFLDTHYWSYYRSGSTGDGLWLGDPRLISFSLKYTF
ncbi:MAG: TonB-dependent receptor [Verrucomicrobiia bacterium]